MIRKLGRRFRKLRIPPIFDFRDYRKTVILAGTGRSGTTWVAEVINSRNDYRIMFEPFHSNKVDLLSDWNYRQYLRPNDRRDKYLIPATSILSGNIRNEWIDRLSQQNLEFEPQKRLIKDIRCQLILNWIKHNYPKIPQILLLRHPCAVANSKLKRGWDTHLEDFLKQEKLMIDFLGPFKNELENAENLFDKHIFMWCVENYVPLRQFNEGEILVIFYEDVCRDPQNVIESIMLFIGDTFSFEILDKIKKPSALSGKDSAIVLGTDLVSSWRKSISDEQISRAVEILSIFGLQEIYAENDMPLVNGTEALKLFSA